MITDCVEWSGFKSRDGYGIIHRGGKLIKAHRVFFAGFNSTTLDAIKDLVIRHKCDNRACINPDHLESGTTQDNSNDRHVRERDARGEGNGMSKLTEADILTIRKCYVKGDRINGARPLARKYGVVAGTIYFIVRRATWAHL